MRDRVGGQSADFVCQPGNCFFAIIGVVGWAWQWWHDASESKKDRAAESIGAGIGKTLLWFGTIIIGLLLVGVILEALGVLE